MNDILVSIRLPKSLLDETRLQIKKDHFMDISEGIRCIIRDKWIEYQNPELLEIKKIRENIGSGLKNHAKKNAMKEVIAELSKIKDTIKKGGFE